jgi:large subunit ribosomal protein L32
MAHPKRKQSHSRTRKRRTHHKLSLPNLVSCSECKKLRLAHMVCPFCGYYKGREVITIEFKEKKKKK